MSNTVYYFKNGQRVIDYFGYWPEFCDAKIVKFKYSKTSIDISSIILHICYIDSDQNKKALIGIRFDDVTELNINNVFNENVLDELIILKDKNIPHRYSIEIIGCYGINGKFICKDIDVEKFKIILFKPVV